MNKSKAPQSVALDGIIDLAIWFVRHPISHSILKNNRVELLNDRDPKESAKFFLESFVIPTLEDDIQGDEMKGIMNDASNLTKEGELAFLPPKSLFFLLIALAYYSQAIKIEGDQSRWMHVVEGRYWHGKLVGITQEHNLALIKNSDKANDVRQAQNRVVKQEFLQWYPNHIDECRSQKEALLTATQFFDRAYSTLEKYLKDL